MRSCCAPTILPPEEEEEESSDEDEEGGEPAAEPEQTQNPEMPKVEGVAGNELEAGKPGVVPRSVRGRRREAQSSAADPAEYGAADLATGAEQMADAVAAGEGESPAVFEAAEAPTVGAAEAGR